MKSSNTSPTIIIANQKGTTEEHGINLDENEREELVEDEKIVALIVGPDRVPFFCSRTTLESKSPVFSAMLAKMPWDDENIITVTDIDPEVFRQFLEYLNSNQPIEIKTCEDAIMTRHLADLYDVRVACEVVIDGGLKLENVVQMYRIACRAKASQGVEITSRMILGNLTAISKQKAFSELEEEYLAQLLQGRNKGQGNRCKETERDILMVLFRWGAGQKGREGAPEEADKGVLDSFLPLLDWSQMPLVINSKEFASLLMDFNVDAFPVVLFGRTQSEFILEFLKESSWDPTTSPGDDDDDDDDDNEASELTSAVKDLTISPNVRAAELRNPQEKSVETSFNFTRLDVHFYNQTPREEEEWNLNSLMPSCSCSKHIEQLEFNLKSSVFENLRMDSVAVTSLGLPAEGSSVQGLPWLIVTVKDIDAGSQIFGWRSQPSNLGLTFISHPQEYGVTAWLKNGRKYRVMLQYSNGESPVSSASEDTELKPDIKVEDSHHEIKNVEILLHGDDQFPIVFDDISVKRSCQNGLGQYFVSGLEIASVHTD